MLQQVVFLSTQTAVVMGAAVRDILKLPVDVLLTVGAQNDKMKFRLGGIADREK